MQPHSTINTEFPTGKLNFRTSKFFGGNIRSFFITRSTIKDFEKSYHKYINSCGVYILLDSLNPNQIYVGKTNHIINRLNSHKYHDKESWWKIEIAFVSDNIDDPLSEDSISYLEHEMYIKALSAGVILADNKEGPKLRHIKLNILSIYREYFNEINNLTTAYGYPIFIKGNYIAKNTVKFNSFHFNRSIFHASAIYNDKNKHTKVLKGSTLTSKPVKPYFTSRKLLNNLIRNGVIKKNKFLKDYIFKSSSTAGSIIAKSRINGKKMWKRHGKSISQLFNKNK